MNDQIKKMRDYADDVDLSDEIEQGHWETDVTDDPMVTTSLRLPKSLLDWIRARAAEQHVKPTAWIRDILEQQRTERPDLEHRVSALEGLLLSMAAAKPLPPERAVQARNTSPKSARQAVDKGSRTRRAVIGAFSRINPGKVVQVNKVRKGAAIRAVKKA
jgi:predicted DNA binding CopG/RHH family protein